MDIQLHTQIKQVYPVLNMKSHMLTRPFKYYVDQNIIFKQYICPLSC